jgi:valyl-tRNA synthetase
MSKSKGNVIDPLHVMHQFGTDALRFTLASMASPGRDLKLAEERIEGYRNFANKIWNAARFSLMYLEGPRISMPFGERPFADRWILSRLNTAIRTVTAELEAYRFDRAASALYHFIWHEYCDWYLELIKPTLQNPAHPDGPATRQTLLDTLETTMRLLHPFMPFITEELWGVAPGPKRDGMLVLSPWPQHAGLGDAKAEAEIGWLIDLVTAIRSVRAEMNITAAIPLVLVAATAESRARAERWSEFVKRLARVADISFAETPPQGSVQLLVRGEVTALPLKGVIDLDAERARLNKEMQKAESDIARVDQKLNNPKFIANADEEVVEGEREKREEAVGRRQKITEALERLQSAK